MVIYSKCTHKYAHHPNFAKTFVGVSTQKHECWVCFAVACHRHTTLYSLQTGSFKSNTFVWKWRRERSNQREQHDWKGKALRKRLWCFTVQIFLPVHNKVLQKSPSNITNFAQRLAWPLWMIYCTICKDKKLQSKGRLSEWMSFRLKGACQETRNPLICMKMYLWQLENWRQLKRHPRNESKWPIQF